MRFVILCLVAACHATGTTNGDSCHTASECGFDDCCMGPNDPDPECGIGAEQACQPIPCDQGARCPSYQRCDPGAAVTSGLVFTDSDGCVDVTCTSDNDCPSDEACVNSYCQTAVGVCTGPCGAA
jgi:hypothetical protein